MTTQKLFVLIILTLTSLSSWVNAEGWENPAEKYINAYKKYLNATCPIPKNDIKHFVYFARDRELIKNHLLLSHSRFKGAQIMYPWKHLEPKKDEYDFSTIKEDLEYLKKYNKKLFVVLQDATFSPKWNVTPHYLRTEEYDGGAILQREDNGRAFGWVAKRWNKKVQDRFALLLINLGKEFDGKIEGINLQETAIGVNQKRDPTFTELGYIQGLKNNMLALRKAFPTSTTMIYANFTPGEWLPWEDKGYLKGIYQYGQEIGVGLGGPDLMVTRKGQLNHTLAQMHEGQFTVPLGIAVQDGNYVGKTGADADYSKSHKKGAIQRNNIVPMLHAFAKDFLKVNYMFWVDQKPYFEKDVVPCF